MELGNDESSPIKSIKVNNASVSVELHKQTNELTTSKQLSPKPRITVVNTPPTIIERAHSSRNSEDDLATFNIFESNVSEDTYPFIMALTKAAIQGATNSIDRAEKAEKYMKAITRNKFKAA